MVAQECRRVLDGVFDLSQDLLLRAELLCLAPEQHVLVLAIHHIAADGRSFEILTAEFSALYQASCEGKDAALAAVTVDYADFALWQQQHLTAERLEVQRSYWRTQLADLPVVHSLPLDKVRPAEKGIAGDVVTVRLDKSSSAGLQALAAAHGVTLFMVLHGALSVLLSRYSHERDIVIGTPVANRRLTELDTMVGMFVNTLVLRTDVDLSESFSRYLEQVKRVNLDAQQHQDVPFEMLVEDLNPVRSTSHEPLYQVMLQLDSRMEHKTLSLPELEIKTLENPQVVSINDLVLSVVEEAQGLSLTFEYSTELFYRSSIERMSEQMLTLLRGLVDGSSQKMGALSMLPPTQRDYLLQQLNDTAVELTGSRTLHGRFEQSVRQYPQQIAAEHCGEQLSYAALDSRANQLAHYLRGAGVGVGDRVGIYLPRSLEMLVCMLGVMKAGAAYVPLDPSYPAGRVAGIVQQAALAVVLSCRELQEHVPAQSRVLVLDSSDVQAGLANAPTRSLDVEVSEDDVAYVYFTSGSTGQPKGAINAHGGVVNMMWQMEQVLGLTAADRVLQFAAVGFDVVVEEVFPAWFAGSAVVLRDEEGVLAGHEFQAMLARTQSSVCELMTVYWHEWVDYLQMSGEKPPACLRSIMLGGGAITMQTYDQWQRYGVPVVNVFGLTETGVTSFVYRAEGPQAGSHMPNGRALGNTRLYLLDEWMQPVPQGVTGELYIGGVGVGVGYLGQPELSAERFMADPFSASMGGRMYRTGDVARYLEDGELLFIGRRDKQVKIRGARVELGEIETQLQSLPFVQDAYVSVRGNGSESELVAYVVATSDSREERQAEFIRRCREGLQSKLPQYMQPGLYCWMEALPLTANGKVNKAALPEAFERAEADDEGVLEGAMEQALAVLWSELLQVEKVGRNSNFFNAGGNSILATRLVTRINAQFGGQLSVRDIFAHPMLHQQAQLLQHDQATPHRAVSDLSTLEEIEW
jgi:amino acid adenylation domain-containing protein